ncbi:MAG: xanthine permease [Deltaproteobacteria bacterium]|nr:MAG: xanthine permease [Deltaproteobacteria bacterium]
MAKKPANLVYGVDDNPPWGITLLQSLQQIFIMMTLYFVYPVIIIHAIGGTDAQAATMIQMSMIGMGVATILQGLRRGPVGSGYLAPSGNGPAYLSASILAAKTGGISLVCGMTIIGGVFEALISRVVERLRALFPPEVAGLVVTMVGVELIPLGIERCFGLEEAGAGINRNIFLVALITYVSMVSLNTWGKGKLRLYPILFGLGVGYLCSYLFGILTPAELGHLSAASWLSFPRFASFGWSIDMTLLLPFLIATLCSSLKDIGDLTTCQKINDSDWKRPDMKSISKGILADSLGDILSGVIGGMGQSTSSSNIGLSLASGATSRRIGYAAGGLLCLLAFFPKLAEVFVIMPRPVIGAILIFVVNFMVLAGIQIITTRMLDARKTFVIGTSFTLGVSVFLYPQAYSQVHPLLKPIFSSGLSLATISAVFLNLIFRLGIAKRQALTIDPGDREAQEKISTFILRQGAAWGARREVIKLAESAMEEFTEAVAGLKLADGPIEVEARFDEMNLDVSFDYEGRLLDFQRQLPTAVDLLEDEEAVFRLSGFIIKNYADRIKTEEKNGRCRVIFHFEH